MTSVVCQFMKVSSHDQVFSYHWLPDFPTSGCYGVPEDDSFKDDHSDESSISTVPWFCDACKAGVENPVSFRCLHSGG